MKKWMIAAVCAAALPFSGNKVWGETDSSDGADNSSGIRIRNGEVEVQDSDGSWYELASLSDLKKAAEPEASASMEVTEESSSGLSITTGKDGEILIDGDGTGLVLTVPSSAEQQIDELAELGTDENGELTINGVSIGYRLESLADYQAQLEALRAEASATPEPSSSASAEPLYEVDITYFTEDGTEAGSESLELAAGTRKDAATAPDGYELLSKNEIKVEAGYNSVIMLVQKTSEAEHPVTINFVDLTGKNVDTSETELKAGTYKTDGTDSLVEIPDGYEAVAPKKITITEIGGTYDVLVKKSGTEKTDSGD